MDVASLPIDRLMDLLENEETPGQVKAATRTEIRRRAEEPAVAAPDITTPHAILMRAVDELRDAGWCDLAHACMVVFMGAQPDAARLLMHEACEVGRPPGHDGQDTAYTCTKTVAAVQLGQADTHWLVRWLVESARTRAAVLWGGAAPAVTHSCRLACSKTSL